MTGPGKPGLSSFVLWANTCDHNVPQVIISLWIWFLHFVHTASCIEIATVAYRADLQISFPEHTQDKMITRYAFITLMLPLTKGK